MGKYLMIISNSIKKNFAYRANNFIVAISMFFSFGILFYFWSSIYRQGNQIGTYAFDEMITYYFFLLLFELLFTANTAWGIGEEVKNGQITGNILKPMDYFYYKFFQSIGALLYRTIIFLPVALVIFYFIGEILTLPVESNVYASFFLLALIAYVMNFIIYFIVGILSFWFMDVGGLYFASFVLISFMQGQWIPLDLLPGWFQAFSNYLPFKYLFFMPVSVASGRQEFEILMILTPLVWCMFLYFFAQFLYKKGIRKYEGYGV